MKVKKYKLSLADFTNDKNSRLRIYGPSSLMNDGTIISFEEQMAIITHYLKTNETGHSKTYKEKACELINDLLEKKYGDNIEYAFGEDSPLQYNIFPETLKAPFSTPKSPKFTFIDLFAGIGGFRIAMQNLGGECVYSSEFDSQAQKTYLKNFGELPFGDITKESTKSYIPDNFDILCAGFPCQAFSIAGYRRGFEDTRGTLFFDVAEIIKRKKPKAVFLENVKNLRSHDEGRTFEVIQKTLEELGYVVFYKVMNAMEYANIPQNRERIFIVCFDPLQVNNYKNFEFPKKIKLTKTIHDCIDKNISDKLFFYDEKMSHFKELCDGITSTENIYQWRRQYVRENKSHVCPTLTANMGTGGHNVPLILTDRGIRKLTPKECLNFQGFPVKYTFPSSITNSSMYKQAGNSVVVPLIQKICNNLISIILKIS
jgi:DNA (cytosine-5)-methyltransferase 1